MRDMAAGHDVVGVPYEFDSVLLSSKASPGQAEPGLRQIGGRRVERFVLPDRPGAAPAAHRVRVHGRVRLSVQQRRQRGARLVLRTGRRGREVGLSARRTTRSSPTSHACKRSSEHVGGSTRRVRFERLPWDAAIADEVRLGEVTGDEPDLEVYTPDFAPSRVTYRYIHGTRAARCGGLCRWDGVATTAPVRHVGRERGRAQLVIGKVDYEVTGKAGSSTRTSSSSSAPATTITTSGTTASSIGGAYRRREHQEGVLPPAHGPSGEPGDEPAASAVRDCAFQGVAPGWIDQYQAGLPSQWLDTTDFPAGTGDRSFRSNPDGLLVRGDLRRTRRAILSGRGTLVWRQTDLVAENGKPVEVRAVRAGPDWDANNDDSVKEKIAPPRRGPDHVRVHSRADRPVAELRLRTNRAPVRASPGRPRGHLSIPRERSATGGPHHRVLPRVGERHPRSLRGLVGSARTRGQRPAVDARQRGGDAGTTAVARLHLPGPRDGGAEEPGGRYSVYTAPVFPGDDPAAVRLREGLSDASCSPS